MRALYQSSILTGCLVRKLYPLMARSTRSVRNIESFAVRVFWPVCECRTDCSPILGEITAAFDGNEACENNQSHHVI
jgi:hypothetical protein